jgi:hypothetical protein
VFPFRRRRRRGRDGFGCHCHAGPPGTNGHRAAAPSLNNCSHLFGSELSSKARTRQGIYPVGDVCIPWTTLVRTPMGQATPRPGARGPGRLDSPDSRCSAPRAAQRLAGTAGSEPQGRVSRGSEFREMTWLSSRHRGIWRLTAIRRSEVGDRPIRPIRLAGARCFQGRREARMAVAV